MMRGGDSGQEQQDGGNDLLATMVQSLMENANDPPRELQGVPDTFLDQLERVPKKALKKTDTCPICCNPFLDGNTLRLEQV